MPASSAAGERVKERNGMELVDYARFAAALVFVLGLIGLLAWSARRFRWPGFAVRTSNGDRRLGVVEALHIDGRHRLVLVRRDEVEHLILVGAGDGRVVETNIGQRERNGTSEAQRRSLKDSERFLRQGLPNALR
jgi:flagellar protein FliO/FliZ